LITPNVSERRTEEAYERDGKESQNMDQLRGKPTRCTAEKDLRGTKTSHETLRLPIARAIGKP
jgi:hypothetical protein